MIRDAFWAICAWIGFTIVAWAALFGGIFAWNELHARWHRTPIAGDPAGAKP